MNDSGFEIKPATVPLSHQDGATDTAVHADPNQAASASGSRRTVALALLILIAGAALWWVSERDNNLTSSSLANPSSTAPVAEPNAVPIPGSGSPGNQLAPFAQSQQALARTRAQTALAQFVEQQILLEESMAVGAWGQEPFDAAMAEALAGDELFVDDRFGEAQEAYQKATDLLANVIASGEGLVTDALAEGQAALDARDPDKANRSFKAALAIDTDNETARDGLARAAQLPQINQLLLQARNFELAGQWSNAVQAYQDILALDAQTLGVAAALAEANKAVGGDQLRDTLSAGFAALEQRQYRQARTRFNAALSMDPGNEVALGGLQQVNARTELATIASLKTKAQRAVADEDWATAVDTYAAALKLDSNIQFAKAGMRTAVEQRDAAALLGRIIAEPNKLSSAQLLEEGRAQLEGARALTPQGPRLQQLIAQSERLLAAYSKPVAVQLTSDNATEILVSTVGKLGAFSTREVSLRPGEYVLLGSRSGCRDVRQTVIVAPGMEPVDIRCREQLPR